MAKDVSTAPAEDDQVAPPLRRKREAGSPEGVPCTATMDLVLALPASALHRDQNQLFVLVQKNKDEYERRPVKVGNDIEGGVEILEGVGPGDRVVTTGSILLKRSVK